jgi:hypothetical protein
MPGAWTHKLSLKKIPLIALNNTAKPTVLTGKQIYKRFFSKKKQQKLFAQYFKEMIT